MSKSSVKWIPFRANGDLVEHDGLHQFQIDDPAVRNKCATREHGQTFYKPNYEFEATLTFAGFQYGRSAQRAMYKDQLGAKYGLFASEFQRLMLEGRIQGLNVCGKWTFTKKGSAYGLIEARKTK